MNHLILNLIVVIHMLVVLFVCFVPFTNQTNLLFLHSIIVPFIILHWVTNNNTCALTIIEKHMRFRIYGTPPNDNECFMSMIINPVYDFTANYTDYSDIIYLITVILWGISCYKLILKYKQGEITSIRDLMAPPNYKK